MNNVYAEVLTIGDEILYGQILDTNSQWICSQLDAIGIKTRWRTTVGDNELDILAALDSAFSRTDLILITGGLGPTTDDLTKPCLAKFFQCDLRMFEEELEYVTSLFKKFGREMTETNRKQAELPEKCEAVRNSRGTAPGMWFNESGKVVVSMPGVPREMKLMMTEEILPRLKKVFETPVLKHKVVRTAGIGESFLADKLKDWEKSLPENLGVAFLPGFGQVRLRLTCTGKDEDEMDKIISKEVEFLKDTLGSHIYGFDDDSLEMVVGNTLRAKGLKIACAESCTGGYLSKLITSVAGSSDYFQGSIVPYHNQFKNELLEVSNSVLESEGAVSEPTVMAMAEGVRKKFKSDIGLATSGIAGPGGGSEEKPVGTVWVGLSGPWGIQAKKFSFGGDREANIHFSSLAALFLLWQRLVEID